MSHIVGVTQDGKQVFSGKTAFWLHDTKGLPFQISFHILAQKGFMIDWLGLYDAAQKAGWPHRTIIRKLNEAILDNWSKEFRLVVIERLNFLGE